MKVLIVHAHPEPKSFNGALTERAVATLTSLGHEVEVSDLYALGFTAIPGADDYELREDPDYLRIDKEQTHAHENGTTRDDIVAEQQKFDAADLVILQFPIWWFSMPAILKGWAERVFTRGWGYLPGMKFDKGLHGGKLGLVSCTTGTPEPTYAPDGLDGDIMGLLWPVHNGLLRYAGMDVLPPYVSYAPGTSTPEQRAAMLDGYEQHLRSIETLPRLFFHSLDDYGPDLRLRADVEPQSGFQRRAD